MKRSRISFAIEDREEIEKYAREKGFLNASALARVALIQYITRHPSKVTGSVLQGQRREK